tara:strand:- start:305 stop:556 length:252 start_codon:yes stop_codon:yes gene_type:complete
MVALIDPSDDGETLERISFISRTEDNARKRALDWGVMWSKEHPEREVYIINTVNQFVWEIKGGTIETIGSGDDSQKNDNKGKK